MNGSEKPRVEWIVVRDVQIGSLTVRLKKLPVGRPKFSIQVGTGVGDAFRSHIALFDAELAAATVPGIDQVAQTVGDLTAEAARLRAEDDRSYREAHQSEGGRGQDRGRGRGNDGERERGRRGGRGR